MSRPTAPGSLGLIGLILAVMHPLVAAAQTPGAISSAPADFPTVTYACLAFDLPIDPAAAKAAIDTANANWVAAAVSGGLSKSSSLFLDAEIVKPVGPANSAPPIPVKACAIVPEGSIVPGLQVAVVPARTGVAGFCAQLEVDLCLAQAAAEAGYTAARPWPRLPIYARWPAGQAAPTNAGNVTATLATTMAPASSAAAGMAPTVEQNSGGLVPLIPCPDSGCPKPPRFDDVPAAGVGVAWFLPLSRHSIPVDP